MQTIQVENPVSNCAGHSKTRGTKGDYESKGMSAFTTNLDAQSSHDCYDTMEKENPEIPVFNK